MPSAKEGSDDHGRCLGRASDAVGATLADLVRPTGRWRRHVVRAASRGPRAQRDPSGHPGSPVGIPGRFGTVRHGRYMTETTSDTAAHLRVIEAELSAAGLATPLHESPGGADLPAELRPPGQREIEVVIDED